MHIYRTWKLSQAAKVNQGNGQVDTNKTRTTKPKNKRKLASYGQNSNES